VTKENHLEALSCVWLCVTFILLFLGAAPFLFNTVEIRAAIWRKYLANWQHNLRAVPVAGALIYAAAFSFPLVGDFSPGFLFFAWYSCPAPKKFVTHMCECVQLCTNLQLV